MLSPHDIDRLAASGQVFRGESRRIARCRRQPVLGGRTDGSGEPRMNDGPRKPRTAAVPADPVSRRDFLEHGTRYGLGAAAASLLARGISLPGSVVTGGALGIDDAGLQAQGTQRAQTLTLSNAAISAQWSAAAGRLRVVHVKEPNGA